MDDNLLMVHLEEKYPDVYITVQKYFGSDEKRREFSFTNSECYTIYILEYFNPWLEELRAKGELRKDYSGSKTQLAGENWTYKGEIDKNGLACGYGIAT